MKWYGKQRLDEAVAAHDEQTGRMLVQEFLRLRAGQKVLQLCGATREAIEIADVNYIISTLLSAQGFGSDFEEGLMTDEETVWRVSASDEESDSHGDDELATTAQGGGRKEASQHVKDQCREQRRKEKMERKEARRKAKMEAGLNPEGDRGGHRGQHQHGHHGSSTRPSRAELQAWASTLAVHSKFMGVCENRYSGLEFRKALLKLMIDAGLSTKPGDLRKERHHPTLLNQEASKICNEALTQATCECHSAGASSLDAKVQTFLTESCAAGLSRVNLVSGLGSHGGGGTIRHLMPEVLQNNSVVRTFQVASNYSAFYVDLAY